MNDSPRTTQPAPSEQPSSPLTPAETTSAVRGNARTRSAQRRRKSRRQAVKIAAILLGVTLVAGAAWGAWYYNDVSRKLSADAQTTREVASVLETQTAAVETQTPSAEYILLLGSDARPGQGHTRSDSIVIARLDKQAKSVMLLSIPRDTRVPVPGHGNTKITHANAYGGPALAITAVRNYTGIPIDHYIELNFAGFARVVDALGGVHINVDKTIDDKNGANSGGVSNVTHINEGKQTLNGAQALTYVRVRHIAGGDYARMKHQQTFLRALATQALAADKLARLPGVINAAADNIETDMKLPAILALAQEYRGFKGDSIKSFNPQGRGGKIGGVYYILPDVAKSQALFRAFEAGTAH